VAPRIPDATLARRLGVFAGMADRVLTQPERWLGTGDGEPRTGGRRPGALLAGRGLDGALPGSPGWAEQPVTERVDWWVARIGGVGGLAAAAPRFAGALADRVPLQAALGASVAGLAVCAVAREHGLTSPDAWVPLIARVVLGRDLPDPGATTPPAAESERALQDTADGDGPGDDGPGEGGPSAGAARAARTLWRLARTFREVGQLLDERPRGGLFARALGKAPVVGALGGWLDERGAVRKAADTTARLLAGR
jgi:hypothetical protein